MDELRKELAEEREMDRLRKKQDQITGSSRKEMVDFLYQPVGNPEVSAEEFLEGKRYTEKGDDSDVKKIKDEPGALFVNNIGLSNAEIVMQDKRYKIREDPMFTMRKEEQKAREKLKDNPLQMKRIREEVEKEKSKSEKKTSKRQEEKETWWVGQWQ